MNFFNIGAGELFLVLILIIMVFGPQRLPEFARKLGKAVRDLRNFAQNIDPELLEDFREITRDIQSVRDEMQTLRSDLGEIQRDIAGAAKEVSESMTEAVEGVKEAATTATSSLSPNIAAIASGAATSTGTASGALAAAGGTASTVGQVSATGATASAPVTGMVATSNTPTIRQPADTEDEIMGIAVPLKGSGDSLYPDEIIGEKVFPLARSAAHARSSELENGHDPHLPLRSRHAVMVSLVQKRPSFSTKRSVAPVRSGPSSRRAVPARSRRTRGG